MSMFRPPNKPMKSNPAGVNNKGNTPMGSRIQTSTNVGGSSGGKITNPMEIPNSQGYVGPKIRTGR